MAEFIINRSSPIKFAPNSTQSHVVSAINLLTANPNGFVAEEKIFTVLQLIHKTCAEKDGVPPLELSRESLSEILQFLTGTGVLEMTVQDLPALSRMCGGGCCGCGRYYRVKIGGM